MYVHLLLLSCSEHRCPLLLWQRPPLYQRDITQSTLQHWKARAVSDFFSCFWNPFSPCGLPQLALLWGVMPSFIATWFARFHWCPWEACPLLNGRSRAGGKKWGREDWKEKRCGKLWMGYNIWEKKKRWGEWEEINAFHFLCSALLGNVSYLFVLPKGPRMAEKCWILICCRGEYYSSGL